MKGAGDTKRACLGIEGGSDGAIGLNQRGSKSLNNTHNEQVRLVLLCHGGVGGTTKGVKSWTARLCHKTYVKICQNDRALLVKKQHC